LALVHSVHADHAIGDTVIARSPAKVRQSGIRAIKFAGSIVAESLGAASSGPKALLRLAVCTIDALSAVLAAWVASVVVIVEITWLDLSGAIEDARVVIEK